MDVIAVVRHHFTMQNGPNHEHRLNVCEKYHFGGYICYIAAATNYDSKEKEMNNEYSSSSNKFEEENSLNELKSSNCTKAVKHGVASKNFSVIVVDTVWHQHYYHINFIVASLLQSPEEGGDGTTTPTATSVVILVLVVAMLLLLSCSLLLPLQQIHCL